MKKIKTLFEREYENHKIVGIKPILTEENLQWVLEGLGKATIKYDGTCCLIQDGKLYARYDFKKGRNNLPEGSIPCQEKADEITGHFPHWVEVKDQSQYKWHKIAYDKVKPLKDGTYELCGIHFNKNKENIENGDIFIKHGENIVEIERTFDGIKEYLSKNKIEGIVFWKNGEPQCKIKRSDFGLEW